MGHLLDGAWTHDDVLVESEAGLYVKKPSQFRNWISDDGSTLYLDFRSTGITYYDDFVLSQGLAVNNPGGIVLALMDDAVLNHAGDTRGSILIWTDYSTINETRDSSLVNWGAGESFTAFRGATYGQTWDRLRDLSNEFRLVPKSTPVGNLTHDLEWFQRGNTGSDHSAVFGPWKVR